MLRVIKINSSDETCIKDHEELKTDLSKSGHCPDELEELQPKAVESAIVNAAHIKPTRFDKPACSLFFSIKY